MKENKNLDTCHSIEVPFIRKSYARSYRAGGREQRAFRALYGAFYGAETRARETTAQGGASVVFYPTPRSRRPTGGRQRSTPPEDFGDFQRFDLRAGKRGTERQHSSTATTQSRGRIEASSRIQGSEERLGSVLETRGASSKRPRGRTHTQGSLGDELDSDAALDGDLYGALNGDFNDDLGSDPEVKGNPEQV